jgi:23S rRNA (guanosine2251-2'-O)-methyltransferase
MPRISTAPSGKRVTRILRRYDIGIERKSPQHLLPGYHAVKEALLKGQIRVCELWIATGKRSPRAREILNLAEERGVCVQFKRGLILDQLLPGIAHQGIVALGEGLPYVDQSDLTEDALHHPGRALIVAADHITDEGNLGALIRTAVFFGAQGLILPKDRSAKVTERVMKRSSGAYAHLPVSRVVNLGRELDSLDKKGFWIIGAAEESPHSIYDFDWQRDLVLVLGSEDRGISRTVRSRCHELVCIPSLGQVCSLNISVAAGIILSEIVRQRTAGEK